MQWLEYASAADGLWFASYLSSRIAYTCGGCKGWNMLVLLMDSGLLQTSQINDITVILPTYIWQTLSLLPWYISPFFRHSPQLHQLCDL